MYHMCILYLKLPTQEGLGHSVNIPGKIGWIVANVECSFEGKTDL